MESILLTLRLMINDHITSGANCAFVGSFVSNKCSSSSSTSSQACCRTPYYKPELNHSLLTHEASHPIFSCIDHLGLLDYAPTQPTTDLPQMRRDLASIFL